MPAKLPHLAALGLLALLALMVSPQEPPAPAERPDPTPTVQIIPAAPAFHEEPSAPPADVHIIEDCVVTWYTADTCGKSPDHPAYGVTASGLPVEAGVTCAVDPTVIPLFSTVCVQYADGSVERFRATDTGVTGNWVDIYTEDYDDAVQCGLQRLTVWWTT